MSRFLEQYDRAIAVLILVFWACVNVVAYWGTWSIDMSAVYMAARFYDQGLYEAVYAAPDGFFSTSLPPVWNEELERLGQGAETTMPYIYPPIWAALLSPLAGSMGPIAFFDLTRILTIGCFAASVFLAWRFMRPRGVSAALFAMISVIIATVTMPFLFSASLNQPQLVVIFLILLSFERYQAGRDTAAGLALGVAAAIKVAPILLVVIFLADRAWRPALVAVGTAAGLALVSVIVTGPSLHFALLDSVSHASSLIPLVGLNMSFEVFIHEFFVPFQLHPSSVNPLLAVDTPWVSTLNRLLVPVAILGLLFATRGGDRDARIRIRLILIYTVTVWLGPVAWVHYFTLPLLLTPGLVGIWSVRKTVWVTAFMAISTSNALLLGYIDHMTIPGVLPEILPQTLYLPSFAILVGLLILTGRDLRQATPATVEPAPLPGPA